MIGKREILTIAQQTSLTPHVVEKGERFPYGAVFRGSTLKKRIMRPTPGPGCRWRLLAASIAANSGRVQPMPGRSDPT